MMVMEEDPLTLLQGEQLRQTVAKLSSDISARKSELRQLESNLAEKRISLEVLQALETSWDTYDPGKYRIASWLLTKDGERCVAKELLPPGTRIVATEKEWEQFLEKFLADRGKHFIFQLHNNGHPYGAVPPHYKVLPLAETFHAPCPACKTKRPVIETYAQTDDSAEGDTWEKGRYVFCCEGLQEIQKPAYSSSRF